MVSILSLRRRSQSLNTLQQGSRELVALVTAVSANLLLHERTTLVDGSKVYGTYTVGTLTHYIVIIFDHLGQTRVNLSPDEQGEMTESKRKRIVIGVVGKS